MVFPPTLLIAEADFFISLQIKDSSLSKLSVQDILDFDNPYYATAMPIQLKTL